MKVLTRSVHKGPRTLDEASINRTLLMIVIYPLVLFFTKYQLLLLQRKSINKINISHMNESSCLVYEKIYVSYFEKNLQ